VFGCLGGYKRWRSPGHEGRYGVLLAPWYESSQLLGHTRSRRGLAYQVYPAHPRYPAWEDRVAMGQHLCVTQVVQREDSVQSKNSHATADQGAQSDQGKRYIKNSPVGEGDMDGNSNMHDATNIEIGGEDRVSEAIILVGAIPCPVMNLACDKEIFREGTTGQITQSRSPCQKEPGEKRALLMIHGGREVVGPGYSRGPTAEVSTRSKSPAAWERGGQGGGQETACKWHVRVRKIIGKRSDEHDNPKKDISKVVDQGRCRHDLHPRWCPAGLTKTQ
jgi:hypothetical protein